MFINKSEPYYRGRSGITCYDIKVHGSMNDEIEQEADNFYYKKYTKTLNIGEEERQKAITEAYIEAAKPRDKRIMELESKIKHMTEHLEPQAMTALFEQVEEEWEKEQRIKELEEENLKLESKVRALEIEQNYCIPNCSKVIKLEEQIGELEKQVQLYKEQLEKNPCVVTPDWYCSDCLEENRKMKELLNRYYMVCTEIPKEYRTMVFDSCLEDTIRLIKE